MLKNLVKVLFLTMFTKNEGANLEINMNYKKIIIAVICALLVYNNKCVTFVL